MYTSQGVLVGRVDIKKKHSYIKVIYIISSPPCTVRPEMPKTRRGKPEGGGEKAWIIVFFFSLSEGTIFGGDNFSGLVARGHFFLQKGQFSHFIFVSLYSGPVVLKELIDNVNLNLRRRQKFWI